jgi:hypothetical protein
MKTSIPIRVLVIVALFALVASAADVTGKWVAQQPGRDGQTREVSHDGLWAVGTRQSPASGRAMRAARR